MVKFQYVEDENTNMIYKERVKKIEELKKLKIELKEKLNQIDREINVLNENTHVICNVCYATTKMGEKCWRCGGRIVLNQGCYICGSLSEREMHHIIPSGIHKILKNETMVLCHSCHITVHIHYNACIKYKS